MSYGSIVEMSKKIKIVVAVHGWVFVGEFDDTDIDDRFVKIRNAKSIRRWGTSKGLGELAHDGPTDKTVLDTYGVASLPLTSVIAMIDCDGSKWE